MSQLEKFDEVLIALPTGATERLPLAAFRKLPLSDRITLIMERRVRYFRAGRELDAADAVRG